MVEYPFNPFKVAFLKVFVTTMYHVLVVDKDIIDCNIDL